ncbi:hypothetical protein [Eubacterium maltosivorans]|uniref:hypothetical protein n=1 Tax=Eubacterium maltosivorans TaxID=2041044 RepID=UPI00142F1CB9|nr:hypothetical protein [Eubacterium maltosivorans]
MLENDVVVNDDLYIEMNKGNKIIKEILNAVKGKGLLIEGAVYLLKEAINEISNKTPV